MRTIEFMAGTRVDEAAAELVHVAKKYGEARGSFNEIVLTAKAGESSEGKAAAQRRVEAVTAAQATHDRLVASLPDLDFENDAAVLDWLCAVQEATDDIGVTVNKLAILTAFATHGFQPSVNCGADFKADDRDNVFRWLVGQALDGLQHVAIHGVIHKFAADWKSKFLN